MLPVTGRPICGLWAVGQDLDGVPDLADALWCGSSSLNRRQTGHSADFGFQVW